MSFNINHNFKIPHGRKVHNFKYTNMMKYMFHGKFPDFKCVVYNFELCSVILVIGLLISDSFPFAFKH